MFNKNKNDIKVGLVEEDDPDYIKPTQEEVFKVEETDDTIEMDFGDEEEKEGGEEEGE